MTHNWKPGDVATYDGHRVMLAERTSGRQVWIDDESDVRDIRRDVWDKVFRPLLVIDPEDREQVERLAQAIWDTPGNILEALDEGVQAALRSLLGSEPEEPTGLGAVVRAGDDSAWVRIPQHNYNNWRRADAPETRDYWRSIPRPITVLSEGWQESTDD